MMSEEFWMRARNRVSLSRMRILCPFALGDVTDHGDDHFLSQQHGNMGIDLHCDDSSVFSPVLGLEGCMAFGFQFITDLPERPAVVICNKFHRAFRQHLFPGILEHTAGNIVDLNEPARQAIFIHFVDLDGVVDTVEDVPELFFAGTELLFCFLAFGYVMYASDQVCTPTGCIYQRGNADFTPSYSRGIFCYFFPGHRCSILNCLVILLKYQRQRRLWNDFMDILAQNLLLC